jgi:endonuclease YncB( thermonuclease family)
MGEKAGDGVGTTDVIVAETPRGERSPPIGTGTREESPYRNHFNTIMTLLEMPAMRNSPVKTIRCTLLTLLCLLTLAAPSLAKEPIRVLAGVVTKVTDGDTIQVNSDGTKLKVRLYGIDAPEMERRNKRTGVVSKAGQPYGEEAFRTLEGKVARQQVRLDVMAVDQYKRLVALVFVGDRNVNSEMVAVGAAWAYKQYLDRPYASEFIDAEEEARQAGKGLWRQANPQPPWEFRKQQKRGSRW